MSGGSQQAPTAYQPQHSAAVDNALAGGIASNTARTDGLYNMALPAYTKQYNDVVNNPGNATAMQGAWDVAGMGTGVGHDQVNRGNQMGGLAGGAIQTGWDPQSANFNWGLGQTRDSANVNAAQSGVAGSPFGANQASGSVEQFIRDWQSSQQQRQGAGIQQLGEINRGANESQGQGLQTLQTSSILPQATAGATSQMQISALNQLVQALSGITSSSNQTLGVANSYLNTGTNAASQATEAAKVNNADTGLLGALSGLVGIGAHFIPGYH